MILLRFGERAFPLTNKRDRFPPAMARGQLARVADSQAYDAIGVSQAPGQAQDLSTSFEVHGATPAALDTALDVWRNLVGAQDQLWLVTSAGELRWCTARLADMTHERSLEHVTWLPTTLTFEVLKPGWYGAFHGGPWHLDSGYYFDDGLRFDEAPATAIAAGTQYVDLTNLGGRAASNIQFRITAGDAAITAVTLRAATGSGGSHTDGEYELVYTGTLSAGKVLLIDCEAKRVTNDGTGDFAHLALGANHKHTAWWSVPLTLPAVKVTVTGGGTGSTCLVAFYEGWA